MAISTGLALLGGSIVGGLMSSSAQKSAASTAAAAQTQAADISAAAQLRAAELGIDEQRRQFDAITGLLEPYVTAGESALTGLAPYAAVGPEALAQQRALAGLGGAEAQRRVIEGIEAGPQYQALVRQGEEAILQRAAATGGLRGGTTQAALSQFRPQVLSDLINQQYSRLGGLTALGQTTTQNIFGAGQAAAARQAAAGQSTAGNITNLLGAQGAASSQAALQAGQAAAGAALARGQATANMFGDITGTIGTIAGMSKGGVFGQGVF